MTFNGALDGPEELVWIILTSILVLCICRFLWSNR